MKTREEQIEEMVEIMCDDFGASFFAERLYDAGYRKQSDTVREFVRRVKEIYDEMDRLYRDYDIIALWSDIIHLAEEYEAEVEE